MNARIQILGFLFVGMFLSTYTFGQDEAKRMHEIRIGAGYSSYQEIPVVFSNPADEQFIIANRNSSLVYYADWSTGPENTGYRVGLDFGYERSDGDVTQSNEVVGAFYVHHITMMGMFAWDYYSSGNWRLGGNLLIGGGVDLGRFNPSLSDLDYSQYDFHYQIDPFVIGYGGDFGIEVMVGYGARGYVRTNLYYRF
ncbi:MAG: hypothetical protein HWE14_02180 [Flavobacteriia bacterium]|nr:hypothetical protein [Flavobacteriia bacterium]